MAPTRTIKISDPFVLRVLTPLVIVACVALVLPGLLTLTVAFSTDFFREIEPPWLEGLRQTLGNLRGLPADVSTLITEVFPAIAVAICFRRSQSGEDRLNRSGKAAVLILLFGLLVALLGMMIVDPDNERFAENILGDQEAIQNLYEWSENTLRRCLTYLFLLIGLRMEVGK